LIEMTDAELVVRQALRLKGRATAEAIVGATFLDPNIVQETLTGMVTGGEAIEASGRFRCTPAGRDALEERLATERTSIDQAALEVLYELFDEHNNLLKALASSWQMRGDAPNDHNDAAYDDAILAQLGQLHEQFGPFVDRVLDVAPRLAAYRQRFDTALDKINAGDHTFFLRPVIDSYHTVWFEFHEELIGLLGRTRQAEAAAGRAD